jgi:hypothetical protein
MYKGNNNNNNNNNNNSNNNKLRELFEEDFISDSVSVSFCSVVIETCGVLNLQHNGALPPFPLCERANRQSITDHLLISFQLQCLL